MDIKRTISITEARKRIFEIAEEVQKPNNFYTFTEKGKPKAVLMSADEFDSFMEDYELLCDPEFQKSIQEAEKEIARGDYVTLDELKRELGYAQKGALQVADKGAGSYGAKKGRGGRRKK